MRLRLQYHDGRTVDVDARDVTIERSIVYVRVGTPAFIVGYPGVKRVAIDDGDPRRI